MTILFRKKVDYMECKYTCFDRVIHSIKKLNENKLKDACSIIKESGLEDFLDFCVENDCFSEEQAATIMDFILMWEDLDGNYYEEDEEKLIRLYEAVGISKEIFEELVLE